MRRRSPRAVADKGVPVYYLPRAVEPERPDPNSGYREGNPCARHRYVPVAVEESTKIYTGARNSLGHRTAYQSLAALASGPTTTSDGHGRQQDSPACAGRPAAREYAD